MSNRLQKQIKGVLLDITGVLYESGMKTAIDNSVEAVNRLRNAQIPFRFVTNETQNTRSSLVHKLQGFGFNLSEDEVFAPAPAVRKMLLDRKLSSYLLVHPRLLTEFEGCNTTSPNCVVIGDAGEAFTYENLNHAFRILTTAKNPVLISMGKGKYYKEKDELTLDLGPFTVALEYACDIKAEVIGKPSPLFFNAALQDIGISPKEAVMIGDDICNDVGGAQSCGMSGVLVRTGKFRPSDEHHPQVKPDAIVKNLSEAVALILENYN